MNDKECIKIKTDRIFKSGKPHFGIPETNSFNYFFCFNWNTKQIVLTLNKDDVEVVT